MKKTTNKGFNPRRLIIKLYDFGEYSRNNDVIRTLMDLLLLACGMLEAFKVALLPIMTPVKVGYIVFFSMMIAIGFSFFNQNDSEYFKKMLSYRMDNDPGKAKSYAMKTHEYTMCFLGVALGLSLFLLDYDTYRYVYEAGNVKDNIMAAVTSSACNMAPIIIATFLVIVYSRYFLIKALADRYKEQDEAWPEIKENANKIFLEYKEIFRFAKEDELEYHITNVKKRIMNIPNIRLFDKKYIDFLELVILKALQDVQLAELDKVMNDYKIQMEFSNGKKTRVKE